jgi:phosphatidylserine decarboxylase
MINILRILPRNLLSYLFGVLVSLELPLFSNLVKKIFLSLFDLVESESEKPFSSYPSLQKMFVRKLKDGARPLADSDFVIPVDGKVSQGGVLESETLQLIQAKGKDYSLIDLLDDTKLAHQFVGGAWCTIYLAPFNYHRIHTPVAGEVLKATHIPGTLWPVNDWSVSNIEKLFCVNERVISEIKTPCGAKILMVKVGATNVGRITLSYTDELVSNTSPIWKGDTASYIPKEPVVLTKGDELGCFELGSTVVIVADQKWSEEHPNWQSKYLGQAVSLGQGF